MCDKMKQVTRELKSFMCGSWAVSAYDMGKL